MPFTPQANLTFIKQTPTLENLSGSYKTDQNTYRAWSMRLNVTDQQKKALIEQAQKDGIKDALPSVDTTSSTPGDRFKKLSERVKGRVAHGWSARLNRSDPTASAGTIEAEQIFVTPERKTLPGTNKTVQARTVTLFETDLQGDKTLSNPKQAGEVVAYELGDSFMLFRKADEADGAADANQGRILVICADASAMTEELVVGLRTDVMMPLPDDMTLAYGVPSGFESGGNTETGDSRIGKLVKDMSGFAAIKKVDGNSELAAFPKSDKLSKLAKSGGGSLPRAAIDANTLFRLATGTNRPGHVQDMRLEKYHGVRNARDQVARDGSKVPPLVHTRGGDTYDQIAFAALNDRKIDIVTVRNGKTPQKSDLIKALDKFGIRSQYRTVYDPSSRSPVLTTDETPVWDPLKDNDPRLAGFRFLRRTQTPDGKVKVEAVSPMDSQVRNWMSGTGEQGSATANATEISLD